MTERDLQRWSREVAEDPGAPSFVRLARSYRRQGRRQAARDVVVAGLERHPEHVDAHSLLALLHVEAGERQAARDEWETVLRLDPGNFDASRGLGYLALERGDLADARRHLDTAAAARPQDPAVRQARDVLARREGAGGAGQGRSGPAEDVPAQAGYADTAKSAQPGEAAESARARSAESAGSQPAASARVPGAPERRQPPERTGAAVVAAASDPVRLFEPLAGEGPFLGGLLLDDQGLVLAGSLDRADGEPELLGGMLATVVEEAGRTAELMRLGAWQGLLLDGEEVVLHVAPVLEATLVVAARRGAPAGWVVRTAGLARELARSFMEAGR